MDKQYGPDEALAGMAKTGAPRVPMLLSAYTNVEVRSDQSDLRGDLTPKTGNAKGATDSYYGVKVNKVGVPQHRLGPRFTISAMLGKQVAPEASATQANGRVVPPLVHRTGANFGQGSAY